MADNDWLAELPVIGGLPPEVAAVKLRQPLPGPLTGHPGPPAPQ